MNYFCCINMKKETIMTKNKKIKKSAKSNKSKINKELKDRISELENKNLLLLADFENLKKEKIMRLQIF